MPRPADTWGGLINDADEVRRSALHYAGLSGYGGERHQRSLEVEVGYCVLQGVQTRRIGPLPVSLRRKAIRKGGPIGPDRPHGRMPGILKRIL